MTNQPTASGVSDEMLDHAREWLDEQRAVVHPGPIETLRDLISMRRAALSAKPAQGGDTGCRHCDAGHPVRMGQHFLKSGNSSMYSEACTANEALRPKLERAELIMRGIHASGCDHGAPCRCMYQPVRDALNAALSRARPEDNKNEAQTTNMKGATK